MKRITVELTEREALALAAMGERIGGPPKGPRGSVVDALERIAKAAGLVDCENAEALLGERGYRLGAENGIFFAESTKKSQTTDELDNGRTW